jgi:quinol monooxygenase YgiN
MITFSVRLRFHSEDHEDITQTLREITRFSRQEPGCVHYIPHWVESDPNTVLIYEQYRDEAAVEHHRASAHFAKFAVGVLYQKMLDRTVENLNAVA